MTVLMLLIALTTALFLIAMIQNLRALARWTAPEASPASDFIRPRVARLARGNVLLQSGRYATAEDQAVRVARLSEYRFDD